MPGDAITIRENKVYINGASLPEDYLPQDLPTSPGSFATEGKEIRLANDQYFVLGDNRGNSSDSRSWGPIENDKIIGRAWIVYLPLGSLRVIK
jgi:signal peptidase I